MSPPITTVDPLPGVFATSVVTTELPAMSEIIAVVGFRWTANVAPVAATRVRVASVVTHARAVGGDDHDGYDNTAVLALCLHVQSDLTEWAVRHAAAAAHNDATHGRFAVLVGTRNRRFVSLPNVVGLGRPRPLVGRLGADLAWPSAPRVMLGCEGAAPTSRSSSLLAVT